MIRGNLLFIHIPRTGGSSIEAACGVGLDTLEGGLTTGSFPDKHWTVEDYAEEAAEGINPAQFLTFTVIRHPLSRLVSTYRFLRMNENHPLHIATTPFCVWLRELGDNPDVLKTTALAPQSRWLQYPLDLVLCYENPSHWLVIEKLIGARVDHLNSTGEYDYREYYVSSDEGRARSLYAADFARPEFHRYSI